MSENSYGRKILDTRRGKHAGLPVLTVDTVMFVAAAAALMFFWLPQQQLSEATAATSNISAATNRLLPLP